MTKQEGIYAMLMRREGATRDELIAFTGWMSISVQAECKQGKLDWREQMIDGVKVFYAWREQQVTAAAKPRVKVIVVKQKDIPNGSATPNTSRRKDVDRKGQKAHGRVRQGDRAA